MAAWSWMVLTAALAAGPAAVPTPAETSHRLDGVIAEAFAPLGIAPAAAADEATFHRRVWLDLAGRIPPVAETRKFLDDPSPTRRTQLVDRLLQSQDFGNHWGRVWAEYFTDQRPFDQENFSGRVLQNYLRDSLVAGKSYRQIVTELLRGEGSSDDSGPANFLLRYDAQPEQLAGVVSKKFLGVTIQCAQCHDHPHVHWKQDDFWGLAAYFARLRKMEPVEEPSGDNFSIILERTRGELTVPDPKGTPDKEGNIPRKTIYPRLPGVGAMDTSDARRGTLIAWLTEPGNPYFARHGVSRVWKQLFGAELVASLDSLQPTSKSAASESPILELLAEDFAASDYDLKRLIRVIVLSDTYQRGAGPARPLGTALAKADGKREGTKTTAKDSPAKTPTSDKPAQSTSAGDPEFVQTAVYARFPIRPLTADQLYLSLAQATGFRGDEAEAKLAAMTSEDFVTDVSQDNLSGEALAVRRSLALLNGDHLRNAADMAVTAAQRVHGDIVGKKHVEWLVLSTLCRPPTSAEMDAFLKLAGDEEGSEGLKDVAWVLLNSAEFVTNH